MIIPQANCFILKEYLFTAIVTLIKQHNQIKNKPVPQLKDKQWKTQTHKKATFATPHEVGSNQTLDQTSPFPGSDTPPPKPLLQLT